MIRRRVALAVLAVALVVLAALSPVGGGGLTAPDRAYHVLLGAAENALIPAERSAPQRPQAVAGGPGDHADALPVLPASPGAAPVGLPRLTVEIACHCDRPARVPSARGPPLTAV